MRQSSCESDVARMMIYCNYFTRLSNLIILVTVKTNYNYVGGVAGVGDRDPCCYLSGDGCCYPSILPMRLGLCAAGSRGILLL